MQEATAFRIVTEYLAGLNLVCPTVQIQLALAQARRHHRVCPQTLHLGKNIFLNNLGLSDVPATPAIGSRVFNHSLGECGVGVFAAEGLAARYSDGFPHSLNGAPFLLPTPSTAVRRSLDQWFDANDLCPKVEAEIEDSALLKTFGSAGVGLFVAPLAVEAEIRHQYGQIT